MVITDIITELSTNLSSYDITLYPPARNEDLLNFEQKLGIAVPDDIKALYLFCNGFESAEDMFRIIPLKEIIEDQRLLGPNCFYFAEYMIYCDMWDITINPLAPNEYSISNHGETGRMLTHSLADFLDRFLRGGVFGKGGFYDWHNEIDQQSAG